MARHKCHLNSSSTISAHGQHLELKKDKELKVKGKLKNLKEEQKIRKNLPKTGNFREQFDNVIVTYAIFSLIQLGLLVSRDRCGT